MKVAIDNGPLASGHAVRGVGFYARELIKSLKVLESGDVGIFAVDFQSEDLAGYEVLHYTSFHPFFPTLPLKTTAGQKVVVTIHDLIPLIYPENYPPGIKGYIRFLIQKYLARKVDAIITDSETSKKDIVRFLGIDPAKVHVVYLAPGDGFKKIKSAEKLKAARNKYHLPNKFVMYLGDVNYNKNLPNLAIACKIAEVPLVICGKQALDIETQGIEPKSLRGFQDFIRFLLGQPHPELAHFIRLNQLVKNEKNIYRLGFVPENDLVGIFNLATVYVQPSFYEGFGLPVVQAFSCGTPVIVSRTNCLVEIATGAALAVNPDDPKDIANKILGLFPDTSTKARLINEGERRAKQFSWNKTAGETMEVYQLVAAGK